MHLEVLLKIWESVLEIILATVWNSNIPVTQREVNTLGCLNITGPECSGKNMVINYTKRFISLGHFFILHLCMHSLRIPANGWQKNDITVVRLMFPIVRSCINTMTQEYFCPGFLSVFWPFGELLAPLKSAPRTRGKEAEATATVASCQDSGAAEVLLCSLYPTPRNKTEQYNHTMCTWKNNHGFKIALEIT